MHVASNSALPLSPLLIASGSSPTLDKSKSFAPSGLPSPENLPTLKALKRTWTFKVFFHSGMNKILDFVHMIFRRLVVKLNPGGFYNLRNSCYINAGIKLLDSLLPELTTKELQRKVEILESGERVESDLSFNNRKNLQTALRAIMEASEGNRESKIWNALKQFRLALFTAGFHPDFVYDPIYGYSRQQDGGIFISAVLNALEYSIASATLKTSSAGIMTTTDLYNAELLLLRQPSPTSNSFQELLSQHFSPQQDQHENTSTQIRIMGDPPEHLFFQIGQRDRKKGDISPPFLFPEDDNVNLALAFGRDVPVTYQITSFEVFHGKTNAGGHYTSFVRHENGRWYHHNDESVKPCTHPQEFARAFENAYNVHVKRKLSA